MLYHGKSPWCAILGIWEKSYLPGLGSDYHIQWLFQGIEILPIWERFGWITQLLWHITRHSDKSLDYQLPCLALNFFWEVALFYSDNDNISHNPTRPTMRGCWAHLIKYNYLWCVPMKYANMPRRRWLSKSPQNLTTNNVCWIWSVQLFFLSSCSQTTRD